jgi:hypothetical protein
MRALVFLCRFLGCRYTYDESVAVGGKRGQNWDVIDNTPGSFEMTEIPAQEDESDDSDTDLDAAIEADAAAAAASGGGGGGGEGGGGGGAPEFVVTKLVRESTV